MTKLRALAVLLGLAAVLSLPCRRQMGVRGIELSVGFSRRPLSDNLFTDVTYRFKTTAALELMTEDKALVSRLLWRGRLLVEDRFLPPMPTSKWEPEREYTFTRRIYIPSFIDEFDPAFRGAETVGLSVGLVPAGGGAAPGALIVYNGKIRVVPAPDSPTIVTLGGWYPAEAGGARWTAKEARAAIDNPGRDALLVIRGAVDPAAPPGQKITVRLDGRVLEEFAPGPGDFERRYDVSKEWLGARKDFILSIAVDKTFIPAEARPGSGNERELGARISLLYFR